MPTPFGGGFISGSGQVSPNSINSEDIANDEIKDEDIKSTAAISGSKVSGESDAYGASWNGDPNPPSKAALFNKMETMAGAPTFKNGVASRAGSTASGSQTIAHGLGKTPSKVKITAIAMETFSSDYNKMSIGVYNGTTISTIYFKLTSGTSEGGTDTSNIVLLKGNSQQQAATISIDATNITLNWTKTGGGVANDMYLMWEVE